MKLSRYLVAVAFALTPVILDAQEEIIYNRESTLHVTLHTQGLGAGYKHGKIKGIDRTTYWNFEVSYLRSLKQVKLMHYFNTASFVYGKLNDVLILRAGYEEERRIMGKPYWGGVELRWTYGIGASLALLKPYYYMVTVATPTQNGGYVEEYVYQTFEDSSQWIDIVGKAPFKEGLNEIKLRPGIHAKGGMAFEIGTSRIRAQSIEFGAMVEYFPQGIPLMAENPPDYVIPTLYLSYSWGSRYNKY